MKGMSRGTRLFGVEELKPGTEDFQVLEFNRTVKAVEQWRAERSEQTVEFLKKQSFLTLPKFQQAQELVQLLLTSPYCVPSLTDLRERYLWTEPGTRLAILPDVLSSQPLAYGMASVAVIVIVAGQEAETSPPPDYCLQRVQFSVAAADPVGAALGLYKELAEGIFLAQFDSQPSLSTFWAEYHHLFADAVLLDSPSMFPLAHFIKLVTLNGPSYAFLDLFDAGEKQTQNLGTRVKDDGIRGPGHAAACMAGMLEWLIQHAGFSDAYGTIGAATPLFRPIYYTVNTTKYMNDKDYSPMRIHISPDWFADNPLQTLNPDASTFYNGSTGMLRVLVMVNCFTTIQLDTNKSIGFIGGSSAIVNGQSYSYKDAWELWDYNSAKPIGLLFGGAGLEQEEWDSFLEKYKKLGQIVREYFWNYSNDDSDILAGWFSTLLDFHLTNGNIPQLELGAQEKFYHDIGQHQVPLGFPDGNKLIAWLYKYKPFLFTY